MQTDLRWKSALKIWCVVGAVAVLAMAPHLALATEPKAEPLSKHPSIVAMHAEAIMQREAAGIKSHYELDEQCCQWAQQWASEMARMGSMVHSSNAYQKGEIIAHGYSLPGSLAAWRASSGHWFWMGGRSKYAGWGIAYSANGSPFYCGCFRNDPPKPQPSWYKPRLVNGVWHCEYSDGTPCKFVGGEWRKA